MLSLQQPSVSTEFNYINYTTALYNQHPQHSNETESMALAAHSLWGLSCGGGQNKEKISQG